MDIDNLQSANAPPCALISKMPSKPQATVFPVLHWFSPLSHAIESSAIQPECIQKKKERKKKVQAVHALRHDVKKQKNKQK